MDQGEVLVQPKLAIRKIHPSGKVDFYFNTDMNVPSDPNILATGVVIGRRLNATAIPIITCEIERGGEDGYIQKLDE